MNKEVFVKKLGDFVIDNIPAYSDVKSLVYVMEDDGREWLYCNYKSYAQRRINISGDSEQGILYDFVKRLESVDWVVPVSEAMLG